MRPNDESARIPASAAGAVFNFQPGQHVGGSRFRLERLIGRGGMGMVWKAFDERLHEPVALKFISEKIRGNRAALIGMRRETSRSHSLSHPQIVRIHDLHEVAGEPAFISMEYVDGSDLQQLARLRENQAFSWEQVKGWLPKICGALEHAHSRGVIHRDLKPANLMLDARGELMLADFGLADALKDTPETNLGFSGGTLAYMSPQQLSGLPAALTDDIYSLGASVFELLSGAPPFSGEDICDRIEFEPAKPLFAAMEERGIPYHEIPEEIEDLVSQCLSKNPERRPQSAAAVLELVGASQKENRPGVQASDAVSPPNPRPWPRIRTVALACVALALGLVLANQSRFRARGKEFDSPRLLDLRAALVRASSLDGAAWAPRHVFDGVHRVLGDDSYRWVSGSFIGEHEEWIAVDLGEDMLVEKVTVDWELAYARDYSLRARTSAQGFLDDSSSWEVVGSVTGMRETVPNSVNEVENQEDAVFDLKRGQVRFGDWLEAEATSIKPRPVLARHLMLSMTGRGAHNVALYSLHEVEVVARPLKK